MLKNTKSEMSGSLRQVEDDKGDKSEQTDWEGVLKKVKSGEAGFRDLFQVVDSGTPFINAYLMLINIDGSGGISKSEFGILLNRMSIKLSEHRIEEVFSHVKKDSTSQDLNITGYYNIIKLISF